MGETVTTGKTGKGKVPWLMVGLLAVLLVGIGWLYWYTRDVVLTRIASPAEQAQIQADLAILHEASLAYAGRVGHLPETLADLVPTDLPELPTDPFGRQYVWHPTGADQGYIWCLGPDGALRRYPPDTCIHLTMPTTPGN
jgi:hypothetical protein